MESFLACHFVAPRHWSPTPLKAPVSRESPIVSTA